MLMTPKKDSLRYSMPTDEEIELKEQSSFAHNNNSLIAVEIPMTISGTASNEEQMRSTLQISGDEAATM